MKISLNFILKATNLLILFLAIYFYNNIGVTTYVNGTTIILCAILGIQTHLFLSYAKKNKNLLLTILSLILILFYMLRVVTLNYTEYSHAFSKHSPVTFSDVNYTLLFIIISNIFFYLGIYLALKSKSKSQSKIAVITDPICEKRVFFILFFSIIIGFPGLISFGYLFGLVTLIKFYFLNTLILVLLSIIYFVYHSDRMKIKSKIIFISIVALYVLSQILVGARSSIYSIMVIFLIAALVNHDKLYLKTRHIIAVLILILSSFYLFLFTTFTRPIIAEGSITYSDQLELFMSYDLIDKKDVKLVLAPIFDRIGFLDYATEIIANKPSYSNLITPSFYFKSIVDNALSPGFNIFNQPKISNALSFVYNNKGELNLQNVDKEYQSDQLTFYGEYYFLGGWFSIIFIFLTAFFFQRQIQYAENYSKLTSKIYKGIVLYFFWIFIDSFGIDWLIQTLITIYLTYWVFKKFIIRKEIVLSLKK